jgi:Uma2 family endonuclease
MPPAGSASGLRNSVLNHQLTNWVQIDGTGIAFDSSTGFTLPNGAVLSPDASWLQLSRWAALTQDEKEGFAPLCPDFAVELRSPSDSLTQLQNKMQEYIANDTKLAGSLIR